MKDIIFYRCVARQSGGRSLFFTVIVCRAQCALIRVLLGHSETIAWRNVNVTTLPPAITRLGCASVPPDIRDLWYVMRDSLPSSASV